LRALRRRRDFLQKRCIERAEAGKANDLDEQENAALKWVLDVVEKRVDI
jgi:hypothetical protein